MIAKTSIIHRLLQHAIGARDVSPVCSKRRLHSAIMEPLETRTLLSTITWGNSSGGNWNTASNWVGDVVPGAGDNAVINVAGGVTITYTSGTDSVQKITSSDPISISGGSLTLTSGASALSDGLTVSGGAMLTVTGGSASLTATGTTNINGGNLTAAAGGTITLSSLTSYESPTASLDTVTLEATGTGSTLDLSHVTSLTGSSVFASGANIEALAGGDVKLNALTGINAQVFLESDGSGSVLNLSDLTTLTTPDNSFTTGIQATDGGEVIDPVLATLTGATLTLDGTGTISTSQITSLTSGQLNLSSGTPNFSGLTNFNISGATVGNGATLAFPSLTSYEPPTASLATVTLEATGSGSTLNLSNMTSLTGSSVFASGANIEALAGGDVKLNALAGINAQIFLESDGSGSVLNLSDLTTLTTPDNSFTTGIQATDGGEVIDPALATLTGATLTLDGTGTISTSQITSLTSGQLNLSSGTSNFSGLTNFNISGATVSGGATLAFPSLTSYEPPTASLATVTLEATGSGSTLNLSDMTSLTGSSVFASGANIEALAGGDVKLNALAGINAQIFLESDGSGSVLNLSDLMTLTTPDNSFTTGIQATDGGEVIDPALATLTGATLTLDGTGTISVTQITSLTVGQLNVSGGTYNFTGLTNFNASGATVSNGATLAFPSLTSYQPPTADQTTVTMQATGTGSTLNLSNVTSLTGSSVFATGANIEALAGGDVKLNALTGINAQVFLESDGSDSVLNLSDLTTLTTPDNSFTTGIQATNGGEVIDPVLATLTGATLTLDGTGTMAVTQITSLTTGQLNVSGGTYSFSGLTNFNASGATVSGGATVAFPSLTSYEPPTASLATVTLEATGSGSTLNLSHVTSLTGSSVFASGANIEALAGGDVKLNALTGINAQVFLESEGSGSVMNLSDLTTLTTPDNSFTTGIQATNGGEVMDPLLATLTGATLTLDGTGTMAVTQITSLTTGQLNVSGGNYSFTGLTNFNASGSTVSNGATLTLSSLTSYQTPTAELSTVTLEATGTGSTLNLSHVTSLTVNDVFASGTNIEALAGGYINLSQLVTVNAQVFFEADGSGSVLDLSNLINITTDNNGFTSGFQASNGGQILRVGSATQLAFGANITGVVAGATLATVTVHVEYGDGQTVPTDSSSVTLTLAGTYPTLNGTLIEAAVNGVATFNNLALPLPGSYTITASDGALTSATSNTITITPTPVQKYVMQIYSDILGRAADAGGLTYWTAQLNAGAPLQSVALGLSGSLEHYDDVVNSYYETYLGRAADTAGLNYWANQMVQGVSAEAIRVDIVSSQEFYNKGGGTDADYVTELYWTLLGRGPDTAGLNGWVAVLEADGRAAVAGGFIYSAERYNDIIGGDITLSTPYNVNIMGFYETYLHRAADPGGLANWVSALESGVTQQVIIADFTSSAEYLAINGITL